MTKIEMRLALREPMSVILTLAFPVMLLVILLAVFGNQPDTAFGGIGGTDYYVPAYAASVIAATGLISIPVHLASYREEGVLKRLRASGVDGAVVFGSQAVVMAAVVLVGGLIMVLAGWAAYDLSAPADPVGVLVGFLAGSVSFATLGVLLGTALQSARSAQAVGLTLFFGMFFIAGGGPPRAILPDWLGILGDWMPMSYVVEAVRSPWTGAGWDWVALAVLAGLGLASFLLLRVSSRGDGA